MQILFIYLDIGYYARLEASKIKRKSVCEVCPCVRCPYLYGPVAVHAVFNVSKTKLAQVGGGAAPAEHGVRGRYGSSFRNLTQSRIGEMSDERCV